MSEEGEFLGIDGGGSSLRIMAVDQDGACTLKVTGGPANILVVGEDQVRQSLRSLLPESKRYAAIVAGIAGADRPWIRQWWESTLATQASRVWVMGDYEIAWAALTDNKPGVVAVFGTGSIFYGEANGQKARVGGYGWKIGDVGSGISLGRDVVRAVLADIEGWGPATVLTEDLCEWTGARQKARLLDFIYSPENCWRRVVDLAPILFARCNEGDGVAEAILARHAAEAVEHLGAACQAIDMSPAGLVGLAGGLAPLWLPQLDARWQERGGGPLQLAEREPVEGAAQLARLRIMNERGNSH